MGDSVQDSGTDRVSLDPGTHFGLTLTVEGRTPQLTTKPVELRGVWWLPEAPDDTIVGTLTFSLDDGLLLDAVGYFKDPLDIDLESERAQVIRPRPDIYSAIHGLTTDSKNVTLCQCIQVGWNTGTGAPASKFSAQVAFVGQRTAALEVLRFTRATAVLMHLPRWTGITGLHGGDEPNPNDRTRIAAFVQRLELRVTDAVPIGDFTLRFGNRGNLNIDHYDRGILEQAIGVELEFATPKGFSALINDTLRHIENFLSIAVGHPSSILDLFVVLAGEDTHQHEARVLLPRATRRDSDRVVEPYRMRFTLRDVAAMWPDPLRRMFEARDEVRSAFDLYFAVVNSPSMYLEVQLLNFAQALETLHRGTHDETVLPADEFQKVRAKIEAVLGDPSLGLSLDPRATLCRKMEHWNELTLRHRLRGVYDSLRPHAQKVVGSRSRFVSALADIRNYLTHRDPGLAHTVRNVPALIRLNRKLRFVVEQSLLQTLGIPDPLLDRHAQRTAEDIANAQVVG